MIEANKNSRERFGIGRKPSMETMMGGVYKTVMLYMEKSLTVEEAIEMIRKIIA